MRKEDPTKQSKQRTPNSRELKPGGPSLNEPRRLVVVVVVVIVVGVGSGGGVGVVVVVVQDE